MRRGKHRVKIYLEIILFFMHPDLFKIPLFGGRVIHTYGVMLMIGFLLSLWQACAAAKRRGNKPIADQDVMDVSIWMLLVGLISARFLFVLLDPGLSKYTFKEAIALWDGGISFDGALAGAVISIAIFCKLRKLPILHMLDLIAPAAMLGYAIGRIGCFFNGCCYGGACNLPWAVQFPTGLSLFGKPVLTQPSHPVQLYSTIISLIFFSVLFFIQRRNKNAPGFLLSLYLIFSAVERFIMEIFRKGITSDAVTGTPFTTAQYFCFFLAFCGILGLVLIKIKNRPQISNAGSSDKAA